MNILKAIRKLIHSKHKNPKSLSCEKILGSDILVSEMGSFFKKNAEHIDYLATLREHGVIKMSLDDFLLKCYQESLANYEKDKARKELSKKLKRV